MNVILIVTTMIMIMASLTYARLQTYRSTSLKQVEFERYMKTKERGDINATAKWWYDNSHPTKQGSGNPKPKSTARSQLSFSVFVDQNKAAQHAKEYPKLYHMAKKLIYYLYYDQPFFQEYLKQKPDIVDSLLKSLMFADTLPKEQKPKKAKDLANLSLPDPILNSFLYFILKGLNVEEKEDVKKIEFGFSPLMPPLIQEEEGEDDDEEPQNEDLFKSPKGYRSLLDFITLDDSVQIRVYLASKELLFAIFDTPETVDAIISYRNEAFNKVSKGAQEPDEAGNQFKALFLNKSDPNFDESVLDFTISKTNPKNYE